MSINRIGTANMYDSTINNLGSRQSSLVDLMEKTTAGKRVLRASDVVSALAPDAFGVVLTRLDTPADGERVAAKLAQGLREPFMVSGQTTVVTVSTGEIGRAHV